MPKINGTQLGYLVWCAIFFAIAAGLFVGSAYFAMSGNLLAAKGGQAPGYVIDMVKLPDSSRSRLKRSRDKGGYRPIVRFTDNDGRMRQFESVVANKPPAYAKGERVTVIYDPADPSDAMIDSFQERYLGSLTMGLFGTVMALFGLAFLVASRRSRG
jgi:hypothetical protein